ncbi:MAG: competence/damage-inducible protein A [Betaproteobacteria bacterium]|nr:competence/damage-inducible protein A [Betaproteobacteria bacterium]
MALGLYIIGDEILSGKRQDKHFSHVQQLLAARGMQLQWAQYLGDDPQVLEQALRASFARGDTVLSCGGIGATPDDHTRAASASALDLPLQLHPQAAELIRQRIAQASLGEPDSPANQQRLQMGMFPRGSEIIPNPYNQIPGYFLHEHYFVPGFPVMAWPMIEWVLDTRLQHLQRLAGYLERGLIVQGVMESELTPLMQRIEHEHEQVKVFSLPSVDDPKWGRHIELGVKGEPARVESAFEALRRGVDELGAQVRTETVRSI